MDGEPRIDVMIWSDFVCPFCNVARERAAFLREEAGARIEWLPFDLHPEYPPEGIPRADLVRRYGISFSDAVRRMNEEAGLVYNPHPERVPNTRRALELGEWARARGAYDAVHERIMDAYWTEGRDITGWDVLAPLVAEAGLDADDPRAEVDAGAYRAPVDASTRVAQEHGIAAVPAFVLDGRLLVSGAQPHEVFQAALAKVREMREASAEG
ncbi:MAG TPA: DsbA family oxidoreductase [Miltoncostaeaceae bacterium]|nr:DsbA family oxidoreductase [Miltoncostaeaceae bacterium]